MKVQLCSKLWKGMANLKIESRRLTLPFMNLEISKTIFMFKNRSQFCCHDVGDITYNGIIVRNFWTSTLPCHDESKDHHNFLGSHFQTDLTHFCVCMDNNPTFLSLVGPSFWSTWMKMYIYIAKHWPEAFNLCTHLVDSKSYCFLLSKQNNRSTD